MNDEYYMQCAFDEAASGVRNNQGGPFGAVVVLEGKIVGRGHNRVTSDNDPTAHAEIVAIREACKALGAFHVDGAALYATCEPCPMCLAAVYWAHIKTICYCYDRNDAAKIGFDDNFIYDEISLPIKQRKIEMTKMRVSNTLFQDWVEKPDKINY